MRREVRVCSSLQQLCIDALFPLLDRYAEKFCQTAPGPLDTLAGEVTELMMERAYEKLNHWSQTWYIFLTPKIRKAFFPWDRRIFKIARSRCKALRSIFVIQQEVQFHSKMIDFLPSNVNILDLDGDLFYRGTGLKKELHSDWLHDAEFRLRNFKLRRELIPEYEPEGLTELHLGQSRVTSEDIADVLLKLPNLRILKHYQLTTALCHLHGKDWKTAPGILPQYKLRNIDADFSHVVRCRMSPHSVLPPDALKLATTLCPEASSIRLRFDSSTPHHIITPLIGLKTLTELSTVCVTSGERPLLDFSDLVPILQEHGPKSLKILEMKVLEEVDPHVIGHECTQLENLTLSGCGYVTPATCQRFRCRSRTTQFQLLKSLFYADGDDFSWDHSLPQCFWKSTMSSDIRAKSFLEIVCLESPRITAETFKFIFKNTASFPRLRMFSICRAPELEIEHLEDLSNVARNLEYLRVSTCEKLTVRFGARIKRFFPDIELRID